MEKVLNFGDEKSLQEASHFLAKLKEAKIDKKYKLIFNEPSIYKKKILSAHFVIKFAERIKGTVSTFHLP